MKPFKKIEIKNVGVFMTDGMVFKYNTNSISLLNKDFEFDEIISSENSLRFYEMMNGNEIIYANQDGLHGFDIQQKTHRLLIGPDGYNMENSWAVFIDGDAVFFRSWVSWHGTSILKKFNISTGKLTTTGDYISFGYMDKVKDEYYINGSFSPSHFLYCYNKNTLNLLWQIDFSEQCAYKDLLGSIIKGNVKQIEIFENRIIASVAGHKLFCIDIKTGVIIWEQTLEMNTCYFKIDDEAKRIYLHNHMLFMYTLDLGTGEIINKLNIQFWQETNFDYFLSKFTIDSKYIYACANLERKLGIIDKNSFEVLDVTPLEGALDIIPYDSSPMVTDRFVYQRDFEGTLHIFEKSDPKLPSRVSGD